MRRVLRVPVGARPSPVDMRWRQSPNRPMVDDAPRPVTEREAGVFEDERANRVSDAGTHTVKSPEIRTVEPEVAQVSRVPENVESDAEGADVWRDRALRLQAEMENFRKRQQRLADERVVNERANLLREFLDANDNLERALSAENADAAALREGVDLTHQAMQRLLSRAGVQAIDAVGEHFDPRWHEAVSTVPHQVAGVRPDTVVRALTRGYQLNGNLLKPARVVVAV